MISQTKNTKIELTDKSEPSDNNNEMREKSTFVSCIFKLNR